MLTFARASLKKVPGFPSSTSSSQETAATPAPNTTNSPVDAISNSLANLDVSISDIPTSAADLQGGVAKVTDATIASANDEQPNEYPKLADLRRDIYRPLPVVSIPADAPTPDPMQACIEILNTLFEGLESGDVAKVKDCFYAEQSYWRDSLALTYHFRTFNDRETISQALIDRASIAKTSGVVVYPGTARLTPAGPTLTWIDCFFGFETSTPATKCGGMLQLLPPTEDDMDGKWKIWTLATWTKDFDGLEEDEARLKEATVKIDVEKHEPINVDVLIVGAGNAGLCLAARLRAYDVSYLAVDKFDNIGDNWALRYDNMRFHVPTVFAQTPYLPYPGDAPKYLHRDDLAAQCKRMASSFDLNVWTKTTIKSTTQDEVTKGWDVVLQTSHGERKVHAKQLVQATGVGSRIPYIPRLDNETAYKGVAMHSQFFIDGDRLKEKGVKSVTVVGSANTAFDVNEACHKAGLETTMIQRSPTYLLPTEYLDQPQGMGIYALLPADIADSVTSAGPLAVGGQLLYGLHQMLAAGEPTRYDDLRKAGFQVESSGDLMNNLLERAGGHYIDMGQTALIAEGKVAIKSGVTPTAFTSTGLKLSDGSELTSDAIIWCTGYADKNVREISTSVLGDGGAEKASKMDATWQLDSEGEIRGMWKRQLNIENFWITGGFTSQHRYYSRFLALQIKATLAGVLPPAYRDSPKAA